MVTKRWTEAEGDACWPWLQALDGHGYGKVWLGRDSDGRQHFQQAHRYVYELLVGPIPAGLTLDHLCRNRGCVNPAHLEPVTGAVNTLRGESPPALNAAKTECVHGHPFDEANTYVRPNGRRFCRACARDYQRERYARRKRAA